ncbi:peptidase M20 domain-containing protein 2-like [Nematolebias whitei]|uniref:peptidase M20 domain-containing protein 2-like n=1 Tax=Nematolebias whitei TaxID=451745 RepID=UPI00189AAAE1|nr:peptidase M20 domain-containing protein 2-like [Nematolebias whitei]
MTEEFLFQITVLGTPAEEAAGRNINLIHAGAFTDMDLVFTAPAAQQDASFLLALTIAEVTVKDHGKASLREVEIIYPTQTYFNILPNATLASMFASNEEALGIEFPKPPGNFSSSTDFGNVSFIVPGLHPFFYIGTDALNHTEEYADAAGAKKAQLHTLRTAKALVMTAVDAVCCPDLLQQERDDFSLAKPKQEK